MKSLIDKIRINFNKAGCSYDFVATVQKQCAEFLVDHLLKIRDFNPKSILDLGTGTGYIPELLLNKYCDSYYYLNDIAEDMLRLCKAKLSRYPNINYLHGDMLKLKFDDFDLIISNFALQWLSDLENALRLFHSKSKNVFAFSTLLSGTFREWGTVLREYQNIKLRNYPSLEKLVGICNGIKKNNQIFEYRFKKISLSFDGFVTFMRYLKLLGASSFKESMKIGNLKSLIKQDQWKEFRVTYNVFFGIFRDSNI
ncbi:MAG: methyltransferase domain-containing protein [Victivallaceae bacterium]